MTPRQRACRRSLSRAVAVSKQALLAAFPRRKVAVRTPKRSAQCRGASWVPRSSCELQIQAPEPDGGEHPLLAGSVNCSSPLKPALGRPRSRIERQLPGEVANSHCRPGAEPRERLLPGTQARRRRLVLPNRGVSRSSRSSNHSPPGTTSAAAEPCHRARSDGRDNRPLGHCGAAIFLRICSRVCSAAAEKGPPRATASLISASASSLRC